MCSSDLARAIGEFGAVSVVSSNIRGLTNTVPLQIDALYNDYNAPAAFALASLLAGLSLVTLIIKSRLEARLGMPVEMTSVPIEEEGGR